MPGADRYSLLIEGRTSGTQEIAKLDAALAGVTGRVDTLTQSMKKYVDDSGSATTKAAQLAAGLYVTTQAVKGAASSFADLIGLTSQTASATEKLVTGYRAARLVLSPTLFTGVSVGVGYLTEQILRNTYATAESVEQNALLAAKMGLSLREVSALGIASQASGKQSQFLADAVGALNVNLKDSSKASDTSKALGDLGFTLTSLYATASDAPGRLGALGSAFDRVEDPVKRSQLAMALFGTDIGGKILPQLNSSLDSNLQKVQEWGVTLSDEGVRGVTKFKREIDSLKRDVDDLGTSAALTAQKIKNTLIETLTAGDPAGARRAQLPEGTFRQATGLPSDRDFRQLLPSLLQPRLDATRDSLIAGALSTTRSDVIGVSAIRNRYATSLEGLQDRRGALDSQRRSLLDSLDRTGEGALSDVAKATTSNVLLSVDRQLAETDRRIESIKRSIQSADEARRQAEEFRKATEKLNDEFFSNQFEAFSYLRQDGGTTNFSGVPGTITSGIRFRERMKGKAAVPDLSDLEIGRLNLFTQSYQLGRLPGNERDVITGETSAQAMSRKLLLEDRDERTKRQREIELAVLQQSTDYQTRMVQLLTGPGGEVDAINKVTALRLSGLDQQKALTNDIYRLDIERTKVLQERELALLDLRKQQREQTRNAGEQLFDATVAGGGGLKQFLLSQALVPARKAAGNLAVEVFGNSSGKLQLPGLGTADNPNLFGRLLQGTPFGINPLKQAGDLQMTAAQIQLQAAQINATGGVGTAGAAAKYGSILGGVTSNPLIFNALGSTSFSKAAETAAGTRNLDIASMIYGFPVNSGAGRSGFSLGKGIGIGAAALGGAYGAYSGFSAGGLQGALTGTASLAGAAAGILPMLSSSLSLAGPIGAIAGLGLGGLAMLLGNPKQKRQSQISDFLEARKYTAPETFSYDLDTSGRQRYTDYRGNVKSGQQVTININAIDAKSFIDRRAEIAEAVRAGVSDGSGAGLLDELARGMGVR